MAALTPAEIVARLRGCADAEVDAAVAECLREPTKDAILLDTRARLVTLLRQAELWPPAERFRVKS